MEGLHSYATDVDESVNFTLLDETWRLVHTDGGNMAYSRLQNDHSSIRLTCVRPRITFEGVTGDWWSVLNMVSMEINAIPCLSFRKPYSDLSPYITDEFTLYDVTWHRWSSIGEGTAIGNRDGSNNTCKLCAENKTRRPPQFILLQTLIFTRRSKAWNNLKRRCRQAGFVM